MKLTADTARKGLRVRKLVKPGHNQRSWVGVTCSEPYGANPNCPRHQMRIDVEIRPRVIEKGVLLSLLEAIDQPQEQAA